MQYFRKQKNVIRLRPHLSYLNRILPTLESVKLVASHIVHVNRPENVPQPESFDANLNTQNQGRLNGGRMT